VVRMERAAAARQARDPRSLVLTTATASFGPPTVKQTANGEAQASLPPKAVETDLALASSFPARPPASTSLLSLLKGVAGAVGCCDSIRLLVVGNEPFRPTDALSLSSQEYKVPFL
jgi:hypothetical protein